jgi:hypothetical protein
MKRHPTKFLKDEFEELQNNNLEWNIRYLEDASKPHSIVNGK